jgi:hypothetical protein
VFCVFRAPLQYVIQAAEKLIEDGYSAALHGDLSQQRDGVMKSLEVEIQMPCN